MRGECVAQEVGVDVLEPRGVGVLADDLPDRDAFEWSACAREEHRAWGVLMPRQGSLGRFEVGMDRGHRGRAHGDEALLVALACDADDGTVFDVVLECDGTTSGAQAAGVHEFEDRAVAECVDAAFGFVLEFRGRGAQELADLARAHDAGELLPGSMGVRGRRRVLGAARCVHPSAEDADRGEVSGDGRGGELAFG